MLIFKTHGIQLWIFFPPFPSLFIFETAVFETTGIDGSNNTPSFTYICQLATAAFQIIKISSIYIQQHSYMVMEEPSQCRHIWKRYSCGGVFQSQQIHHCSKHPIDDPCPNAVIDHYQDTGKNCRTCIAIERASKKIIQLQREVGTLKMAQSPDLSAISRLETAIAQERNEINAWRLQGHVDR